MPRPVMPRVDCSRGAPKGRVSSRTVDASNARNVHLFRVPLDSGGYDSGGAYWGSGPPSLYCARADAELDDGSDYLEIYTRANSRREAAELLGVAHRLMRRAY